MAKNCDCLEFRMHGICDCKDESNKTRIKLFTGYDTDIINSNLDNFFNENPMIKVIEVDSNLHSQYKSITVIYNIL